METINMNETSITPEQAAELQRLRVAAVDEVANAKGIKSYTQLTKELDAMKTSRDMWVSSTHRRDRQVEQVEELIRDAWNETDDQDLLKDIADALGIELTRKFTVTMKIEVLVEVPFGEDVEEMDESNFDIDITGRDDFEVSDWSVEDFDSEEND